MAHQGYGFCEFLTEEDAEYACKIMNQIKLWGKPIRVNKVRRRSMILRCAVVETASPFDCSAWIEGFWLKNDADSLYRRLRTRNSWMLAPTCSLGTWMKMWMSGYCTTRSVRSV